MKRHILIAVELGSMVCSIVLIPLVSCDSLHELTEMEPPEVLSHSPKASDVAADSLRDVRVVFSRPMNRTLAERSFSMENDTGAVTGSFRWSGETLVFRPHSPFEEYRRYTVSVDTAAEDHKGNNLKRPFSFRFSTGFDKTTPRVVSIDPGPGSVVTDPRHPVTVQFSVPVDRESVYRGFRISPEIAGTFTWNNNDCIAVFVPVESYLEGVRYRIDMERSISSLSKRELGVAVSSVFTRSGVLSPKITYLETVSGIALEHETVNPTVIGREEEFEIVFSDRVREGLRDTFFQIEPRIPFSVAWYDNYTRAVVTPETFVWDRIYTLLILETQYFVRTGRTESHPPVVAGLQYIPDTTQEPPDAAALFPFGWIHLVQSENAAFDITVQTPSGAGISLTEFVRAFSLRTTNACADIIQRSVEIARVTDDLTTFRVHAEVIPGSRSGTVRFVLEDTLTDTFGNSLAQPYELVLNQ
jgi:hypothetical protein